MSTQLRLVEPPAGGSVRRPQPRRARLVRAGRARRARWDTTWGLDAKARRIGREGVATARAALAQAKQADPPQLSKAS